VFVALLALAIANFVWSLGGTWPIRNRDLLVRTVSGRPGRAKMPSRWLSLLLALFMLGAGIAALALADDSAGGVPLDIVGLALAALFLARGGAGYTHAWRRTFTAEPFATLDRRTYS